MYCTRVLALLIVCCLSFATSTDAATARTPTLLQAGNQAFRAGNYRAAISKYEQAKAAGDRSAALDFNLGVATTNSGSTRKPAEPSARRLTTPDSPHAPGTTSAW